MPREDTIICMDNSEWMRNGDYSKSRFDAQYQAIEYLIRNKIKSHPENTLGLISLAGGLSAGAQVLVSPTSETFRVGKAARSTEIGGKSDLLSGLKIAQLALKFRPQRSIQARIIVFLGSPVSDLDASKLNKVGKQLRKNNIAVDVIAIGDEPCNADVLEKFIKTVEKKDGTLSNFLNVPPGEYIEDVIGSSAMAESAAQEELDPMLALALAESRAMAQGQTGNNEASNRTPIRMDNTSTTATQGESLPNRNNMEEDEDEDELLQQAMLMSMMEENAKKSKKGGAGSALSSSLVEDLLESAGVDKTSKEVKEELEDLKKAEDDSKKDEKGSKKD